MRASFRLARLGSPLPVMTMMGRSDQGGWRSKADAMLCTSASRRASSPITATAAPTFNSSTKRVAVGQMWQVMPPSQRAAETRSASRPLGARIKTRELWLLGGDIIVVFAVYFTPLRNQNVRDAG